MSLRSLFIYPILLVITMGFISCDSTTSPENPLADSPAIKSFDIVPSDVNFTSSDGIKDTTVTILISGKADFISPDQKVVVSIFDQNSGVLYKEETLDISENDLSFETQFEFETPTTFFHDFKVFARISESTRNTGYAEGLINIHGFSVFPPEILEINHPDSVRLPAAGENAKSVLFQAKVSDQEGLASLEGVFLRLISRTTGELSSSPFLLYDNGTNGDRVAMDSVFSRGFQFNAGNEPDEYDVEFYAVDRGGLVSDTLKSIFYITE